MMVLCLVTPDNMQSTKLLLWVHGIWKITGTINISGSIMVAVDVITVIVATTFCFTPPPSVHAKVTACDEWGVERQNDTLSMTNQWSETDTTMVCFSVVCMDKLLAYSKRELCSSCPEWQTWARQVRQSMMKEQRHHYCLVIDEWSNCLFKWCLFTDDFETKIAYLGPM